MPRESGTKQERIAIQYFEGVNSSVQQVIARRTELSHSENARAPMIGVIEKRQGQAVIGTDVGGGLFASLGKYGLVYFEDEGTVSQGLIRVASRDGSVANLYYLNQSSVWTTMPNDLAINRSLAMCSFANVDSQLVIVNGVDPNIMITGPITAVNAPMVDSTTPGSLFNSPNAYKVAFYKSRIYLADYYDGTTELKTTVLRSSYPLGIISLTNGDVAAATGGSWVIPVVDTKYFYVDAGMNIYEIYRGNNKVATITINSMTETSITAPSANVVFESGYSSFLSSDEIWIYGTFSTTKQYRWIDNATSIGRDVKQYDTFKLVGGDEDAITILEPIGNVLLIANKNTMMTWNDYTLENFDMGVGCVSKNGYVKLRKALYLIHYSGIYSYSSVYSYSGNFPQLLSRKVERYVRGATKAGLEASAAGFKGLSVFFTIGDVTLYNNDGSLWKVLPLVCLEFNTADQNWYVHTNVTATQFETYIATDGTEKLTMDSITPAQGEILGAEMITNGAFTDSADGWSVGAGWTYGSNIMTYTAP